MSCNQLTKEELILGVVGLGYVGMPLAVAFARKGMQVIGFDASRPLSMPSAT